LFKILNPTYSQREGREELFERDRHSEPVPGWHSSELACALLDAQTHLTNVADGYTTLNIKFGSAIPLLVLLITIVVALPEVNLINPTQAREEIETITTGDSDEESRVLTTNWSE
jgi:hypothetical protein